MNRRRALLLVLTPVLFVGSSAWLGRVRGAAEPMRASPAKPADSQYSQVRAEYVDLYGNRDETDTTLVFENRSMSTPLVLDSVLAFGANGLSDLLASDDDLAGVTIPPLGSLDVPVDAAHFPGLQPKTDVGVPGLESVGLSWTGGKNALRLIAIIHLEQPGNLSNRVINYVEGHCVEK